MSQTIALLRDSYRELNAKRLFWVVLAITALGVGLFASVGLSNGSLTVLTWTTPIRYPFITPATLYKQQFVNWGVSVWLTWAASILALVSTAGIFPDLMAGGSIDLYLSKPISRPRLFATKVLGGLLFVALQVTVFCLGCFIVLRVRGGVWQPGLFVAVPLVVLMFSYLFAVCVLVGVVTRSTIAALLVTLLFWLALFGLQFAEQIVLTLQLAHRQQAVQVDRRIASLQTRLDHIRNQPAAPTSAPTDPSLPRPGTLLEKTLDSLRLQRQAIADDYLATPHNILLGVLAPLPKTSGTVEVLERQLLRLTDLPPVAAADPATDDADVDADGPPARDGGNEDARRRRGRREESDMDALKREVLEHNRARSAGWILGSSVAFEAVVLGLACWLFCRRDY